MDVSAFNSATTPSKEVVLGAIAQSIWVDGFRRTQKRTIQVSRPINAPVPNLFDRLTKMEDFSFAAGQSFNDVGSALIQLATFPDTVPTLAHLRFSQGNQTTWLGNCGIDAVELVEKRGALVIFSFKVVGGSWSKNKPF